MDLKNLTNNDLFKVLQENWYPFVTENWKILGIFLAILFLFLLCKAWKWIVFLFAIVIIAIAIKVTSISKAIDKVGTTIMKSMIELDNSK